jgi:hypothetical protein
MDALRPRVPHLVLSAADADATLRVDGEIVVPTELTLFAVDPGKHALDATAPAKQPWHMDVLVPATDGAEVKIAVPALVAATGKVITVNTTNGKRVAAIVVGAIGAVGVATGVVTGILVLDAKSTADRDCTPVCADQSGRDAVNRGKTLVPINDVAWGVGAAGLGGALVLYLLSRQDAAPVTNRALLAPMLGPGLGGVGMEGTF